ncbi:phage antirepressor KilAC domain-containing protein [Paenibacillus puldeungensis]|uniref:Phage antirepressor KilAC domain-containing protein n=1 Tax=Paenibacillus puldeungensis TaxID=696536 RepID=A0ABW3S4H3_9BACL
MNQLTIRSVNGKLLADSREVAEMIEIRHADLLEKIKGYIQYLLNGNFRSSDFFIGSTYKDNLNREKPCYLLTRNGCDMVANKMTGEKGVLFTAAYVTKFTEMERQLSNLHVPRSLPEALRLAADLAEKNQMLLIQAEQDRPKVLFADAVATSKTSILVGELAKILKQNGVETGPIRLFSWLRDNGYLISRKGTDYNMPTQRSMELGLFEIKETSISHSDGHVTINKTPKVTGKGQVYFVNKFKDEQQLA